MRDVIKKAVLNGVDISIMPMNSGEYPPDVFNIYFHKDVHGKLLTYRATNSLEAMELSVGDSFNHALFRSLESFLEECEEEEVRWRMALSGESIEDARRYIEERADETKRRLDELENYVSEFERYLEREETILDENGESLIFVDNLEHLFKSPLDCDIGRELEILKKYQVKLNSTN